MKLTTYRSSITASGEYMKVFFGDFTMTGIIRAPEGWHFHKVSQWRKGCQDECWRIVYCRDPLSQNQEQSE